MENHYLKKYTTLYIKYCALLHVGHCLFECVSVCCLLGVRQRHITLVERLKSHTATSEALVMSQAKLA